MNQPKISPAFFTNLVGNPTEVEVNTTIEFEFDCGLTVDINAAGFVSVCETGATQGASMLRYVWRFDGEKFVLADVSAKRWHEKCRRKNLMVLPGFRFRDIEKLVHSLLD